MGGTPHANTTHFPNDESLQLEFGTGPKPSIAEVLDRGGAAVEREGAYPVPSPRGTLPTWTPSGDDLNLVHNRRSSLVQARISGIFFFWGSVLSLRPAFTSFAFSSLPSPTEAWVVLRPHPICHKSQEYIRRGRRRSCLDTAQSKESPAADCACPTTRLQSCPHPWQISSCEIRSSSLLRTDLVDRATGQERPPP